MSRLPQPGSDSGVWGNILNDYLSQSLKSDGTIKDNVITSAQIQDGTVTEAQLDTSVQSKLNTAGSGGVADGTITTAKLQDGAVTDVKVATNAGIAQSKIANLTTDLAGKAAVSHTHVATDISNSTTVGRSLLTAVDAASARTAIGAGTSNLVLGTTNTTAKPGDYAPTKSDVGLGSVDNTSDATKNSATATLTNKTIDGSSNTLQNIPQSAITNLTTDLAGKVATTVTVNGHALSSNVTVTAADVLPTQTGNSGRFLSTDGSSTSWATVPAGGDASTNTSSSVDSEIALFSGTGGKTIKRATGTGIATVSSGVLGVVTAPFGAIVGTTDTQTLTNKTISGSSNIISSIALSSLSTTGTASSSTYLRGDGVWSAVSVSSRVTTNNQTGTTYTLALSDAGLVIELNNAAAITLTVPPNSSVAFTTGDMIELWQQGAGQVTVAAGVGVTIRSSGSKLKLTGQYSGAALRYRGSDEWVLVGDLTP